MSARILKFSLDPVEGAVIDLPVGSRFLDLQVQGDAPVTWWRVPFDQEIRYRACLSVVATGFTAVDEELTYLGTFQLGEFVGHVFCNEPEVVA